MKVVVLGDLHFVAPDEPRTDVVRRRRHFAEAWRSFRRLGEKIRREAPDLVISLGDVVDWYSPQNRDFGIGLLEELGIPWVMTPGNHDFQSYRPVAGQPGVHEMIRGPEFRQTALEGWRARGIDLSNRAIEAGRFRLILMESALSAVPEGTEAWLAGVLDKGTENLIFTHVPLNLPCVVEYILSVDPQRNLTKYVQSGSPHLFHECLEGKTRAVFSAHLHFPGRLEESGTVMHLLPLSIAPEARTYAGQGQATVLVLRGGKLAMRSLSVDGTS